jgi:hypothetical protein
MKWNEIKMRWKAESEGNDGDEGEQKIVQTEKQIPYICILS